jgi:hypothetical protein
LPYDSPEDIVEWQTSHEVPGSNYKANDRSVVVLLADLQGTGLQKLNRNYVVIPFGGDGQLTAVTGG